MNPVGFGCCNGRFYGNALSPLQTDFASAPHPAITFAVSGRPKIRTELDIVSAAKPITKIRTTTSLGGP